MKRDHHIHRRGRPDRRPARPRRGVCPIDPSIGLERRALLAGLGLVGSGGMPPVEVSAITIGRPIPVDAGHRPEPAGVAPSPIRPPVASAPPDPGSGLAGVAPSPIRPPVASAPPGPGLNPGNLGDGPGPINGPPAGTDSGPLGGHRPSMSVASTTIDGAKVDEVAVVDPMLNTVRVTSGGQTLFEASGFDHPEAVALADLNGDSIPDLVVANSGQDNILVYAGLGGGKFGPELNGGKGFAAGLHPVGLEVGDLYGEGHVDLVVTNRDSDDVSIFEERASGDSWQLFLRSSVKAGLRPFKSQVIPADADANQPARLVICNSGSGDVFEYAVTPDHAMTDRPKVIDVGPDPSDVLVGKFGHHPDYDMVAINGTDDRLTYVSNVFAEPSRRQFAIGFVPVAMAAVPDPSGSATLALLDAAGGVSLLGGFDSTVQVTSLMSAGSTGLGAYASIAFGASTGSSFSLYAIGEGDEYATLLQFDLGDASLSTGSSAEVLSPIGQADESPALSLVPASDPMLSVLASLGGRRLDDPDDPLAAPRDGRSDAPTGLARVSSSADDEEPIRTTGGGDASSRVDGLDVGTPVDRWAEFVAGSESALLGFRGGVDPLTDRDAANAPDRDRSARNLDDPMAPGLVDDALAALWVESTSAEDRSNAAGPATLPIVPGDSRLSPLRIDEGRGVGSDPRPTLGAGLIASALAGRLIFHASPPRPPGRKPPVAPGTFVERVEWPEATPDWHD